MTVKLWKSILVLGAIAMAIKLIIAIPYMASTTSIIFSALLLLIEGWAWFVLISIKRREREQMIGYFKQPRFKGRVEIRQLKQIK